MVQNRANKMKKGNFFLIFSGTILLLIIGITSIVFITEKNDIKKENKKSNNLVKPEKNITLKNKEEDYSKEISYLKNRIKILQQKYNLSNQLLIKCEKSKREIIKKNNFKFYNFLSKNENIPQEIINTLKNHCLGKDTLNIGCSVYVLRNKFNLNYKDEKDDSLKDINSFLTEKGGDCEDWSFFFMVLINYFKIQEKINRIKILVKNEKDQVVLYEENDKQYVLKGYSYIEEDIINFYPSLICYEINETLGHCQLAFINNLNPTNSNISGFVIEPQNGLYEGKIKKEKGIIYKIKNNKKNKIYLIMNNKLWYNQWGFWLSN